MSSLISYYINNCTVIFPGNRDTVMPCCGYITLYPSNLLLSEVSPSNVIQDQTTWYLFVTSTYFPLDLITKKAIKWGISSVLYVCSHHNCFPLLFQARARSRWSVDVSTGRPPRSSRSRSSMWPNSPRRQGRKKERIRRLISNQLTHKNNLNASRIAYIPQKCYFLRCRSALLTASVCRLGNFVG